MAGSAVGTENRLMGSPDIEASDSHPNERGPAIQRLLFVADAAVADVDELPAAVRARHRRSGPGLRAHPTLPGRLAWLADDVDRFRHIADERLDTVLATCTRSAPTPAERPSAAAS